jgi:uncharacterized membrane-anchored protein
MRAKIYGFVAFFLLVILPGVSAQTDSSKIKAAKIEQSLHYQTGNITFRSCNATLSVPAGFKYLDAKQSNFVLHELWGNPSDSTILGMLVPANQGVLEANGWAYTISFENMGYVKDDDAADIDYKELLTSMQKDAQDSNELRTKQGYPTIALLGWAATPHYDKDKKVLYWAKELRFGKDSVTTLNYNLRILGKDGVFVLNAVATMHELKDVSQSIDQVLASIKFGKGSTYADFKPGVDKVAEWTIGGLVAGTILAKTGFFVMIAKFAKIIIIALIAAGTGIWKFITGKKNKEEKKNDIAGE